MKLLESRDIISELIDEVRLLSDDESFTKKEQEHFMHARLSLLILDNRMLKRQLEEIERGEKLSDRLSDEVKTFKDQGG
jgi:hypothetical protein